MLVIFFVPGPVDLGSSGLALLTFFYPAAGVFDPFSIFLKCLVLLVQTLVKHCCLDFFLDLVLMIFGPIFLPFFSPIVLVYVKLVVVFFRSCRPVAFRSLCSDLFLVHCSDFLGPCSKDNSGPDVWTLFGPNVLMLGLQCGEVSITSKLSLSIRKHCCAAQAHTVKKIVRDFSHTIKQ
jgi:hypothetical protein